MLPAASLSWSHSTAPATKIYESWVKLYKRYPDNLLTEKPWELNQFTCFC